MLCYFCFAGYLFSEGKKDNFSGIVFKERMDVVELVLLLDIFATSFASHASSGEFDCVIKNREVIYSLNEMPDVHALDIMIFL